jgi:serine/threonine protein kinase
VYLAIMAPFVFRQNEHIIFDRGQKIPISKQNLVYKNSDTHVEVFRAEIPASGHAFPNKNNQAVSSITFLSSPANLTEIIERSLQSNGSPPPNRRLADYIARGFNLERENMLEITRLSHDRLVPLLASFEDERFDFGQFNLVVPFANGGSLDDFLHAKGLPAWLLESKQLEHWRWDRTRKCLVHCTDNRDRSWCTLSMHQSCFQSRWSGNEADEAETVQNLRSRVFLEVTDLLDALAYLHECSEERHIFTIHRDIKPSNILIIDGRFKFADFGLSRIKSSEDTSKTEWLGGTHFYSFYFLHSYKEILLF